MLAHNPHVALVTGGMPGAGQDAGESFVRMRGADAFVYHVLPKDRGEINPDSGILYVSGETFTDSQFI